MARGRRPSSRLDKIVKALPTGARETIDGMGDAELRGLIVRCAEELDSVEADEKSDPSLKAAREQVKDYSAAYKDAKKAIRAKISYALLRREEVGKSA